MADYRVTVERNPRQADLDWLTRLAGQPFSNEHQHQLGVLLRDAQGGILGGVYGWLHHGWLYIDNLWLLADLRGQGYGTRLMMVIEQAAVERGVNRSYLATTSFQARPFYEKLGYDVFVKHERFIGNTDIYMMKKDPIEALANADPTLAVEDPPPAADIDTLQEHLNAFNILHTGPVRYGDLAVFLRDDSGVICGGISGWLFAYSFSAATFWLDAGLQAYWPDLLAALEDDIAGDAAPRVYMRVKGELRLALLRAHGYRVVGRHDDFPAGSVSYYLEKARNVE